MRIATACACFVVFTCGCAGSPQRPAPSDPINGLRPTTLRSGRYTLEQLIQIDIATIGFAEWYLARLAEAFPEAPVIPVWIQGAGRVLPKGTLIPVPMTCCVLVGEPIRWEGRRTAFMDGLREALLALKAQAPPLRWDE